MERTDSELERLAGGKLLVRGSVLVPRVVADDVIVGMVRVHGGRRDVKATAPDVNLIKTERTVRFILASDKTFLYVRYSFLLIYFKFCDLSLLNQ